MYRKMELKVDIDNIKMVLYEKASLECEIGWLVRCRKGFKIATIWGLLLVKMEEYQSRGLRSW